MHEIINAQNVAAIWFTVFFGLCLLLPLFTRKSK